MFTVGVEHTLIEHCKNVLAKHNFGKRFTANGTKEQQLTGIIGQSVIMTFFDKGYPFRWIFCLPNRQVS